MGKVSALCQRVMHTPCPKHREAGEYNLVELQEPQASNVDQKGRDNTHENNSTSFPYKLQSLNNALYFTSAFYILHKLFSG